MPVLLTLLATIFAIHSHYSNLAVAAYCGFRKRKRNGDFVLPAHLLAAVEIPWYVEMFWDVPMHRIRVQRERSCAKKNYGWERWDNKGYYLWDDITFLKHFRMKKVHFDYIADLVNQHNPNPVRSEFRNRRLSVAVTLYKLAHGVPDSVVGTAFGIPSGSVHKHFWAVVPVLNDILLPIVMPPITHERLQRALDSFAAHKRTIPGILGAIDGLHIRILRMMGQRSAYWNYKHNVYTLACQGIAMGNLEFLDFATGFTGGTNDAGMWHQTSFGKGWQHGTGPLAEILSTFPVSFSFRDNNSRVHYKPFLIGDGAYPLLPNLIKPFEGQQLSPFREQANRLVSGRRSTIERAFGVLLMRWGLLRKGINSTPHCAVVIINACVALHNYLCRERLSSVQYLINFKRAAMEKRVRVYRNRQGAGFAGADHGEFRLKLLRYWVKKVDKDEGRK